MTQPDPPSNDLELHRELAELLPWFVNGALGVAERRRVERHLRRCSECRREVEEEEALRAALATPGPWPAVDAEASLQLLLRRIDSGEGAELDAVAAAAEQPAPVEPAVGRRRARTLSRFLAELGAAPLSWRLAALVPTGVAVCLALLLVAPGGVGVSPAPDRATGFDLLADPGPSGPSLRLWVRPADGIAERELRELLVRARAQIVAGPTSRGVYTVLVPVPPGGTAVTVLEGLADDDALATVVAAPGGP